MRKLLLLSTAVIIPASVYASSSEFITYTHTNTPIELASISQASNVGTELASVCFMGYGDCDPNMGFGKGDDDYSVNTATQCLNEGFIKLNCNSVQSAEGICPYNPAYGKGCKCASNLVSCSVGQVGVGETCNGKYISCQCAPTLETCPSNKNGSGATCGGKYQTCTCKPEYQYTSSNCPSPRSVSGSGCDGKYTNCICPVGVGTLPYGCEEYYPSPCNSVCKKAYGDNCRNRTSVQTPYGCMTSWSDCSSKCQTAYPDNCRNRIPVPTNYGCQIPWYDCMSSCQIAYSDNCRNRNNKSCGYGCQTSWSDCSSKCQTCNSDNCHNRTDVDAPYGCQVHWEDCSSKCQIAAPITCYYAAKKAHPEAVVVATNEELQAAALLGKKIYLSDELETINGVELKNGTALHPASELSDKCKKNIWNGGLKIYKDSKINVPFAGSLEIYGSFSYSKNITSEFIHFTNPSLGGDANVEIVAKNNSFIGRSDLSFNIVGVATGENIKSISIENLKAYSFNAQSEKNLTVTLSKSANIAGEVNVSSNVQLLLEDGTFILGQLHLFRSVQVFISNSTVNLSKKLDGTIHLTNGGEITLDNSTVNMTDYYANIKYFNASYPNVNSAPDSFIRFKNNSKLTGLGLIDFFYNSGYGLQYIFDAGSHSYIERKYSGFCSDSNYKIAPADTTKEARIQNYTTSDESEHNGCLNAEYCSRYAKCTNIRFGK